MSEQDFEDEMIDEDTLSDADFDEDEDELI